MGSKRRSSGSVIERDGRWYAVITLRDKTRYWERLDDSEPITREDAKDAARTMQRDYDAGKWDPKAPLLPKVEKLTVLEHCRAWVKLQTYDSAPRDAQYIERYLSKSPIAHVLLTACTKSHAKTFVRWLTAQPSELGGTLSAGTVRSVFGPVRRAFADAADDDVIPVDVMASARKVLPAQRDKVPGARDAWTFEWDEVRSLVYDARVPADRRVLNALRFGTGARTSELAVLRIRDWDRLAAPLTRMNINRARSSVGRIEGPTKTGARKPCPVHPALAAILMAWIESGWEERYGREPAPDDYLVPSRRLAPRAERNANLQFKTDCVRVGIRARHQHCARHAFISRIQDDGGDGSVVKWITHAPPKSAFDGYSRAQWGRLCAEVSKLRFPSAVDARVDVVAETRAVTERDADLIRVGGHVASAGDSQANEHATRLADPILRTLALTASTLTGDADTRAIALSSHLWPWHDQALLDEMRRAKEPS